ncbi:MFS transporter [Aestuariibius sp. 2305UL40-4]|uniref:MFS transporter n=1 Tax=Aestuariibius violaceus TaxID=3234132 RepID=UPI00345ED75D
MPGEADQTSADEASPVGTGSQTSTELEPTGHETGSALAPLRNRLFAALFIATTVSNFGTWVQDVGRAWLMTELTPSATLVALVQSAAMAAMALLVLPAGVMADLYDRRRLLLGAQIAMLLVTVVLGLVTISGAMTPTLLLGLTFALAAAAAFSLPTFQAMIADIVGESDLTQALVLNGISFNLARAVGPALGGVLVAAIGPGAVFLLNAVSFAGVVGVLFFAKAASAQAALEELQIGRERALAALRAGLRYARNAPSLRSLLMRTALFSVPASALWALLPLVARRDLQAGPEVYGLLLAAVGIGSLIAGVALAAMRKRADDAHLVGMAGVFLGAAIGLLALAPALAVPAMILAGMGWMICMALLTAGVQVAVPGWIRGRATSLFMMVFAVGMGAGSLLWGALADIIDLTAALVSAGVLQLVGTAVMFAWPMPKAKAPSSTTRAAVWPEPNINADIVPTDGPVLVTVQYAVRQGMEDRFHEIICRIASTRRASGTVTWDLFEHGGEPRRFMEVNLVATWDDHLRQRSRQSAEAVELEQMLRATLQEESEPRVVHWIGAGRKKAQKAASRPTDLPHTLIGPTTMDV